MSKISLGVFKFSNSFCKTPDGFKRLALANEWTRDRTGSGISMLFFLFSISISIYSSVLQWWPVRTMVGLDLFLILLTMKIPSGFLSHEGWNSWFLKGPHTPGHRLPESVISLVIPALAPRTFLFLELANYIVTRGSCTVSFPGMFPPPDSRISTVTHFFIPFHYCWKTSA